MISTVFLIICCCVIGAKSFTLPDEMKRAAESVGSVKFPGCGADDLIRCAVRRCFHAHAGNDDEIRRCNQRVYNVEAEMQYNRSGGRHRHKHRPRSLSLRPGPPMVPLGLQFGPLVPASHRGAPCPHDEIYDIWKDKCVKAWGKSCDPEVSNECYFDSQCHSECGLCVGIDDRDADNMHDYQVASDAYFLTPYGIPNCTIVQTRKIINR